MNAWTSFSRSCWDIRSFNIDQIKSNLFIWHFSYFKSNTKCLTEAKNNNDKTHQPSHPFKYPERHIDVQTHTCTHTDTHAHTCTHTQTHKVRPTAPIGQRHGRAPGHKARKKPPLGADHTERAPGPRPQGSPPQRQSRPGQTRGPTPRCRVLQPPGPEQSTGQHPLSGPKAAPRVVGPHEETLELKTDKLKQKKNR